MFVMFGMLVSINPRLRERTQQFVAEPQWESVRNILVDSMVSSATFVHGYADHHVYLFTFLVAACIFFFLMLKVIS